MSEKTAPITEPETPASASASPFAPSPLNTAQLDSLTKTEEIARVAGKPEYLAALVAPQEEGEEPDEADITAATITSLLADCLLVRNYSLQAASATTTKEGLTDEEADGKEALLAIIRKFQARARQKHFAKAPHLLTDYGIGQNLEVSRAILEQFAEGIYLKTATDKLPKIAPADRAALQSTIIAYKNSQTSQTGGQSTASKLRISRDELLKRTVATRMQLQFAAEAEWPHTDPANLPIRREFQLPANRPFVG